MTVYLALSREVHGNLYREQGRHPRVFRVLQRSLLTAPPPVLQGPTVVFIDPASLLLLTAPRGVLLHPLSHFTSSKLPAHRSFVNSHLHGSFSWPIYQPFMIPEGLPCCLLELKVTHQHLVSYLNDFVSLSSFLMFFHFLALTTAQLSPEDLSVLAARSRGGPSHCLGCITLVVRKGRFREKKDKQTAFFLGF